MCDPIASLWPGQQMGSLTDFDDGKVFPGSEGLHGSLTDLDFGHPPRPVPCYPPCFGGAPLLRQQAKSSILRRRGFFDSVSTVCFHSVQQVQQVQQRSTGEFLTLIRFGDRPFRLTSQFESHKIR